MNLTETAQLMTMIAAFSGRNVDKSAVVAWQSVLEDIALADAEEAVRRHFASSTDFLMVAHVRRGVEQIELERARAARRWAPGQAGVAPEDAMPEIEGPALSEAAIAGMPPELRAFLNKLAEEKGVTPEQLKAKLAPRQAFWEQKQHEFVRVRDGEPNPLYKPTTDDVAAIGKLGSDDYNPFRPACEYHTDGGYGFMWDCGACRKVADAGPIPQFDA